MRACVRVMPAVNPLERRRDRKTTKGLLTLLTSALTHNAKCALCPRTVGVQALVAINQVDSGLDWNTFEKNKQRNTPLTTHDAQVTMTSK